MQNVPLLINLDGNNFKLRLRRAFIADNWCEWLTDAWIGEKLKQSIIILYIFWHNPSERERDKNIYS